MIKQRRFALIIAAVAFHLTQADAEENDAASELLDPSTITITGNFVVPRGLTPIELAIRATELQSEQKEAAELKRTPLDPILKYLPGGLGATMNSPIAIDDDPFFTPEYLKLTGRLLDAQLAVSEKRGASLFAR